MDARLIALKLFLDELDVPSNIETIDDRKRVQKAVYLGQLSGVDLGYRFGWYLKGPYSTELTKDYYSLAGDIAAGDRDYEKVELQGSLRERLQTIRPLMEVPEGIPLSPESWLELVSSLHFLYKVRGLNKEAALNVLKEEKPQLSEFADNAEEVLHHVNLLP